MPVPLTEAHLPRLQALAAAGFELVAFTQFPAFVGVKKNNCAALLEPLADGRLQVFSQPGYLIEGNISVVVEQGGEPWFVWKSQRVRATAELLAALKEFQAELGHLLDPSRVQSPGGRGQAPPLPQQ